MLSLHHDSNVQEDAEGETTMDRKMKRLKTSALESQSICLDTLILMSDLNLCERVLSVSSRAIINQKKGILCTKLESQLFLYRNRVMRGFKDMKPIINDEQ